LIKKIPPITTLKKIENSLSFIAMVSYFWKVRVCLLYEKDVMEMLYITYYLKKKFIKNL